MYTFKDEKGRSNQAIERSLSKLEDQFERLRRDKIMKCEPLTDEDKAAELKNTTLPASGPSFRLEDIRLLAEQGECSR